MRVRGLRRLAHSARWIRHLSVGSALILLYHRIAEPAADPFDLCVTPQHFAEHLEQLRRHHRIISLTELSQRLASGATLRHTVVLTFDDGYADNLHHAKPLLERYDAPATVFVTSGYVGQDREFWWDELERLLLLSPR